MKKWIFLISIFITIFCYSQGYKDQRGPIRMLYGGDTLIIAFSGDTNDFSGSLDFYKKHGALIIDSLKFAGSETWVKSFVNPSSSVDLSLSPAGSVLIEMNDTIGWYSGLVSVNGRIFSLGIISTSTTGNVIETDSDTNWIKNTNSIGANILEATGVGGSNILKAKNTNEFWANDTIRAVINSGGLFIDSINARTVNIHMNDSVIFHSGTNLVGFWNRDSTYLYINDSNIVKMSDTILIIATKSDLHDNIYALEGVIKDGDTIKLGGEYTNNIDIYSDSLRGFKIRNSNSLIDFNYDITDGIMLLSHSKDYNTSSELFLDTLGWYTYFIVVGDSVTEMIADTGGLRYCSEYYWKDQTDPLWIPPKAYVDNVAQLRYISIDISSADILAGNEVTLIASPGAGKSIFPQSMVFSTPDGTAYTGGGNNVLELGGMVEKIYTSEALDLDSQYQSYYYTTPFYETQTANGTPENKALTLDLYTHSTGNKTLNVQIWYTILKH